MHVQYLLTSVSESTAFKEIQGCSGQTHSCPRMSRATTVKAGDQVQEATNRFTRLRVDFVVFVLKQRKNRCTATSTPFESRYRLHSPSSVFISEMVPSYAFTCPAGSAIRRDLHGSQLRFRTPVAKLKGAAGQLGLRQPVNRRPFCNVASIGLPSEAPENKLSPLAQLCAVMA
ncbi:hypothetical protein BKA70DRAFT_1462966 [Coprinopsis sp. MPI-PUGE-AT-0042]|nr:hypothetical protein BKA70DRAFT_1462966 [Coprinopsis sp. MPI-PUGE-AT-0042]